MLPVALALGSSLLWGVADFSGGLLSRRHALLAVLLLSQVSALAFVVAYALLAGQPGADGVSIAWAVSAGALGSASLAAFYRGLAIGTMSIVAPIAATGAAVPVVAGLVGGERPGVLQSAGIVAALTGIVLASREPGEGPRGANLRASVLLALVAAVGFGYFAWATDRAAADAAVPWVVLWARLGETGLIGLAALATRPALPRDGAALGRFAALGAVDVLGAALFTAATTKGLISVVAVLGSLYPAVTVVLARVVLGERVSRLQEAGVVATLAGVVAISAG